MLQHLVILLDDTSVSYCHADNPLTEQNLIPIETLRQGIIFGMKRNLMIQYVFPSYQMNPLYSKTIESIDNIKIFPLSCPPLPHYYIKNDSDVGVSNSVPDSTAINNLVIRLSFEEACIKKEQIAQLISSQTRVNLCFTDIQAFSDQQIQEYYDLLKYWTDVVLSLYLSGLSPQFNLLTDRIMLKTMRNCNAGINSITLAPNGKFYLCPAFYYDEVLGADNLMNYNNPKHDFSIGNIENGISIPNRQLLLIDNAPICRKCDAYQCKRCSWLNWKLTWEINTPSHQQCVMAHLEREASRSLLAKLRNFSNAFIDSTIPKLDYLDPFEICKSIY